MTKRQCLSPVFFQIKNIAELCIVKNFKTTKIKQRIKMYPRFYRDYHQRLQTQSKYKLLPKNQKLNKLFKSTFKSASDGMSIEQDYTSALAASTNYFKMPLTICLFLTILISSQIANCQTTSYNNNKSEQSDNTYLFISYLNKNNTSVNNLYNNKSLIEDSESRIDNIKKTKNVGLTSSDQKLWLRKRKDYFQQSRYWTNNYLLKNVYLSNQTPSANFNNNSNDQLIKIVMDGLGLRSLPDYNKANISQLEYETKYKEYLKLIRKKSTSDYDSMFDQFENNGDSNSSLSLISIRHNSSVTRIYREKRSSKTVNNKNKNSSTKSILLRFPLDISDDIKPMDIEEANIRLLLITSPALATSKKSKRRHGSQHRLNSNKKKFSVKFDEMLNATTPKDKKPVSKLKSHLNSSKEQSHFLNLKVYQLLEPKGKIWIDGRKIEVKHDRTKMDESTSQWLQFDVTKAVEEWVIHKKLNLGLEIQCEHCMRNGARIIDDTSGDSNEEGDSGTPDKYDLAPVLNIIGRLGTHREKRSKHYHNQMTPKPQKKNYKSNCYKDNQRCCRHSMEVVFKEIKGFEFIIQPKVFDAGFCRGRCPPRYNPAHHHALLQSLIWKQNRKKVPRPCCAPSKLIELEVLHVDEKDNEKLKISTWTDMRVLECACS